MTEKEFREDGALNEETAEAKTASSVAIAGRVGGISATVILGMSLLIALRKPADIQHVHSQPAETRTMVASKNAFHSHKIELESGEHVPVRFLDDGFTLQIGGDFFQLHSINVALYPLTAGVIRHNMGSDGISAMEYDTDNNLIIHAGGNCVTIHPEGVRSIVTKLHAPSSADQSAVHDVPFCFAAADSNCLKNFLPTTGTMSIQFWHLSPLQTKQGPTLTAQSK